MLIFLTGLFHYSKKRLQGKIQTTLI